MCNNINDKNNYNSNISVYARTLSILPAETHNNIVKMPIACALAVMHAV